MNFKQEYKELYNSYNKKLKLLHKNSFKNGNNPTEYFVAYLRFLRDYLALSEELVLPDGTENIRVTSLVAAVEAYDAYKNCIHKYYRINNGKVEKAIDGTAEEVQEKYNKERSEYWHFFWAIVKQNMESWGTDVTV